ncbi:hypothetical protein DFH06DRAFT_1121813 [Mycena polygramma]|nr:hypothetical protein DFH06DRAFT_1121813 [Mycena polygramma]
MSGLDQLHHTGMVKTDIQVRSKVWEVSQSPDLYLYLRVPLMVSSTSGRPSAESHKLQNNFSDEEINSIAISRDDGMQRLCDSYTVPRCSDGVPFRQIAGHGENQPLTYKGGLSILASRYPEFVACHTILHGCLLDYTDRGLGMIHQRGWRYATTDITGPANIPFPFADRRQNLRFRVVNATMALNGLTTLAELGNSVMKLRFRDPEFVSHLLHSDMLRATDVDEVVTNEEASVSPCGIQAHFDFTYPLPTTNPMPFQTERCDDPTRVLGTWAALPTSPAPAELTVASGYVGIRRPNTPEPSHCRVPSVGIASPQPRVALSRSPTPEPAHPGYHFADRFVRWTPPVAKKVPTAARTRIVHQFDPRGDADAHPQ